MLNVTANENISDVRAEETLLFFPTAARRIEEGKMWEVPVHGIVFDPANGGLMNSALLGIFRRFAGINKEQAETENFQKRARAFLADNQGNREIVVRLGDKTYSAGKSASNGHFQTTLKLPVAEVEAILKANPNGSDKNAWLTWQAILPEKDSRAISGRAYLIPSKGVSIISDIDDTIKISNVTNRAELMQNTFVKPFEPVPGMSKLYAHWSEQGATVHYVSASPYQLYVPLEEFLTANKFPLGPWELRYFRWKDSSGGEMFGSKIEYKTEKIEPLLLAYPDRQFVCVGDSGEQDPETYGLLARKYPKQITKIYIRNLSESDFPSDRSKNAFTDLPESKWKIYRTAEELDREKLSTP